MASVKERNLGKIGKGIVIPKFSASVFQSDDV
jgi:hypothetical protein